MVKRYCQFCRRVFYSNKKVSLCLKCNKSIQQGFKNAKLNKIKKIQFSDGLYYRSYENLSKKAAKTIVGNLRGNKRKAKYRKKSIGKYFVYTKKKMI